MTDPWGIEDALFAAGAVLVAGVDEAGRGPLAGPVYAAAVILPRGLVIDGLDDSKKLTPRARDRLFERIRGAAVSCGIASASVEEIETLNILGATFLAMNRAVSQLSPPPDISVIDGNRTEGIASRCVCAVGGDGRSESVAAASVLAKVSRDRYMEALAERYPQYGFEKH